MGSDGSGDETCSSITLDWIGLDGDGDRVSPQNIMFGWNVNHDGFSLVKKLI